MAQNDTPGADKATEIVQYVYERVLHHERFDLVEGVRAFLAAIPASEPEVRCQCCGYLVTESEHKGCLRAAAPAPVSGMPDPVFRLTIVHDPFGQEKSIQWAMLAKLPQGTHDLFMLPVPASTLTQSSDRALWTDEQRENHRKNKALVYSCTECCARKGEPHLPSCSEQGICGA